MDLVTIDDITAAAARLDGTVPRTPLLPCSRLSDEFGVPVYVKAENLQHTGSFKVRGATNALLARRERGEALPGVATFSAGNHAAATSFAARTVGVPAVVCMPPGAVSTKIEAVRRYGGDVVLTDDLVGTCHAIAAERGYPVLHPFDDVDVIAGQGTVGAEILDAGVDPELVLVPVGGGGLISGVSAALRSALPDTRIVGVEPVSANAMSYALRAGRAAPLPARPVSLADGLTAPFAGDHTLAHVRELVDSIVEIPEEAIAPAWWALLDATKLLVEPSAAVCLAAVHSGLVEPRGVTVFVLSGGNASPAGLAALA